MHTAAETPLLMVFPFVTYLLLIAALPLLIGSWWERNTNKLILSGVMGLPVMIYLFLHKGGVEQLLASATDYVSFMALLGALFAISGGIYLQGSLAGTPAVNT